MQKQIIEGFQLSPQQKHLWSLQQDSLAYQSQGAILIEGNLKTEFIEIALKKVISQHEILRTNFLRKPGIKTPLQVVSKSSEVSWHNIDLSNFDCKEQKAQIEKVIQKERQQNIDFDKSPLLRLCLLKLSAQKHILLISLPAICADGKTLQIIVEEIHQYYAACLQGEELSSAEEIIQYIQFSEWQNQLLNDEDCAVGKEYWIKQDLSALTTLKLPFGIQQSNDYAKFEFNLFESKIEPKIVTEIEAIARKYETSISIVLLTCWHILLSRITGQQDIIIGTAFDGRQYEELERSLGLFTKYLPLNCHFETDSKFSEILQQINQTVNDAYEWQEYFTVEEIVKHPETFYFPIEFEYEQWTGKILAGDVWFSLIQQYICLDKFKLKLSCNHYQDALITKFHYDVNYFSEDNIKLLAEQFQTLLVSVINNPDSAILKLNILSENQRNHLLIECNKTTTDYPQDKCIHQLFEEQVTKTPDKIAVVFEEDQLSYSELNSRANKIAHYLQQLGVGPDVLVGICVERSLEMIIALLGILKAGGAYLPIDPTLPTSGIALRLQDAQVPILLTQQHLVNHVFAQTTRVVCLDTDWEAIDREASDNPTSKVKPENLVYVIYTSGSTGIPKGVLVEHQQLLNYLYSIQEKLNFPVGANFATVSTFAADLSNTVIFPSLCSGGCLHVVSSDRSADPEALADYFFRHPIDCLKIVPSHLKALLSAKNSKQVLPRQRLVLGGEATNWNLIEQIQQLAPDCQIFNHYGPTEATVGVLTYRVESIPTNQESQTVPIGRPLANTQIYLLDSLGQPVPIGVTSELHIGGAGLARGYLNQPEQTAEKFIDNPFIPGKRLYKTGDLARYRSDGNIEFVGRIDDQVKLHGFRIELGEIEASLLKHHAVSETVVILREDQPGNKRLVAYVVPKAKLSPTTSELREFLLELLPEYMLPAVFVQLKALPLTANGKVNRQLLPAPDTSRPELKAAYLAPRTPNEKILADIWAQVLRVEQVGIYDNFFELGGDSIISIQIVARANQAGLKLTPKQLFEHQTIVDLAAAAGTSLVMVAEQDTVTGSLPLTPIQHWFFEQNQPEPHHWNQSVLLQVRRSLDPVLLQKTVQQLLIYHDALRLHFVQTESSWQQINADFENVVPFTQIDLSALPETEQQQALETAAAELQTSLDLSSGPLVRVALFNLGASKPSRLLILIHHLAVDGVSWRILLEDFQTVYEQLERGEAMQLPPKTTSFKRWAQLLTEYAHSTAVQQEWDYWRTQTQKSSSSFPVDYLEGDNTAASEKVVSVSLSKEETQALLQEVPAAYRTQINEVLLTALVQAFAELTGENSLLVEMEGHGREEIFDNINLSRTVGWFTTHFPLLLDLGEVAEPGTALKLIKEQLRSIPHRGIGYGLLRYLNEDSNITGQLAKLPQPQVKFNYLGQFDQVMSESSLFAPAHESTGLERSLQGSRDRLLVVNSLITSGQLQLNWSYSENIHRRITIETLAENFVQALRELITHCQSSPTGGYTPSDFSKANVSQEDLDQLLAKINQGNNPK
ncbi:amino acid adenylation domain-containing protein [Nostoc sp. UIC 10607]|uniref:amino acid adenylation domain-containing protein n=1 Tax=Nostoc sp. UIC 10607 TaxID=3045935 RepID=UPI00399F1002